MKKNKIMSGIISAAVLLSSITPAFAYDIDKKNFNDVAYNLSYDGEKATPVTNGQLISAGWNPANLNGAPAELYEDFPMSVESEVNNSAELSFNLLYLRQIPQYEAVNFTITERSTGETIFEHDIKPDDDYIKVENVPIGHVYNFELNAPDTDKKYSAVVTTNYESAGFPGNISLTSVSNADGMGLRITETRTESNKGEDLEDYIIPAAELPQLYQTLSNDKMYVIQMSAGSDQENTIKGFFSKRSEFADYGIFAPRHHFYDSENFDDVSVMSTNSTQSNYPFVDENNWTKADLDAKATNYIWYNDVYLRFPTNGIKYKVFKIDIRENMDFILRTFGNQETHCAYWIYNPNEGEPQVKYVRKKTGDNNISASMGLAGGQTLYVMIYMDGIEHTVFNFKRTDVTDDVSNSIYEVTQAGTYAAYNTNMSRSIDYGGDVDIFAVNRNSNFVDGNYSVCLEHVDSSTGAMKATLWIDAGWENGWVFEETDFTLSAGRNEGVCVEDFRMAFDYKYFIATSLSTNKQTCDYKLEIKHTTAGDRYEPNNNRSSATIIPDNEGCFEDVTLHHNDTDYFKFNTGAGGANVRFIISKTETGQLYDMALMGDGITTVYGTNNGSVSRDNRIELSDLPANTDCYLKISSSGKHYSPGAPYWLDYRITKKAAPIVYSAVLSENVTLNKTVGEDSTIDSLKSAVAAKTTFYSGTTVIPTATALNDAELYYTSGSTETLLTTAVLNELAAGTYPLTLKFHSTAATGGTITLVVAAAASNIAEVNIAPIIADAPEWDWAYCAQMLANARLAREGSAASSKEAYDALIAIYSANDRTFTEDDIWDTLTRVSLTDTAKATRYIYTGGATTGGTTFKPVTNTTGYNEDRFFEEVSAGKACILLLKSIATPNDLNAARYVVLCGVNKENHTFKIADPVANTTAWYPSDAFYNGGAMGNSDLKFSGSVIEFN